MLPLRPTTTLKLLNDKERSDYTSLAKAMGIDIRDLLLLEFYNQNTYDSGGIVTSVKYTFPKGNPVEILNQIKGLDKSNSVIIEITELNFIP